MKRIAFLLLTAVCLTGCSGEYVREGVSRQNETPSVEVVSGGAVSGGAVSGQAVNVEEAGSNEEIVRKDFIYCNSTDLYVADGDDDYVYSFSHRKLDGTFIEKIEPEEKDSDSVWLCLVEEDWVYYGRYYETLEGDYDELWRAPIQKGKKCDKVLLDQEELLISEKDEIDGNVFVIGDMLYYSVGTNREYRKYDMKKKEQVIFTGKLPGRKWNTWLKPFGDTIIMKNLSYGASGKSKKAGLYTHKNKSNKFQLLDNKYDKLIDEVFTPDAGQMYYVVKNNGQYEVRVYRRKTGQTETLFTSDDFHELLNEVLKSESYSGNRRVAVNYIDADVKRIYIDVEVEGDNSDTEVIFSCEIGKETSTLRQESGLTDFLTIMSDEYDILCAGCFLDGNQCVAESVESGKMKSYNMNTGEVKEIKKSDPEYWWQYYEIE